MKRSVQSNKMRLFLLLPAIWALLATGHALAGNAAVDGLAGTVFNFTAKADYITTADGGSYLMWLYADGVGRGQYPGPTLIVDQGDTVVVNLANELPEPVSIVFPGQESVVATGNTDGIITKEAVRDDPLTTTVNEARNVTYSFVAREPGTYLYHSGSHMDLQVEMGLLGVIVVRPAGFDANNDLTRTAYGHYSTRYHHEYLFLLTEMDPVIHQQVEFGRTALIDTTKYWPVYWMMNGRTAPDDMMGAHSAVMPTQPYNCLPRMHPGEKVLMRVVTAGRDLHPLHHHGNHAKVIARDGRLLTTGIKDTDGNTIPDLAQRGATILGQPGQTVDAIFEWTGKGMGWDIYGHAASDPLAKNEDPADHGKPFPVVLPEAQYSTFGAFYSGTPFMGSVGALPPGEGGLNPNGGFTYMWHSHTEKELTNNNIFPGGMLTMLIIDPWGVDIP